MRDTVWRGGCGKTFLKNRKIMLDISDVMVYHIEVGKRAAHMVAY